MKNIEFLIMYILKVTLRGLLLWTHKVQQDGIISPDGIPDFNELWQANGTDFGRGYRTGSTGKHNYTYKDNKIYIVPAEGNEGATCGEGGCFYILKYVLNPETGKYEKI